MDEDRRLRVIGIEMVAEIVYAVHVHKYSLHGVGFDAVRMFGAKVEVLDRVVLL